MHLLGNMIFLYVFGNTLEEEIGALKTLAAFFSGGVVSFILSTPFYGNTTMVGASAAIFTLTAIVMLTRPLKFSIFFLMPVGLVAILYFFYNLIAIQQGIVSNIGYAAHIIGFTIGLPLGISWSNKWKDNLLISLLLLVIYVAILLVLKNLNITMLSIIFISQIENKDDLWL